MIRSMIAPLSVAFLAFTMVLVTLQLFKMDMFSHINVAGWIEGMEEIPAAEQERRAAIRRLPIGEEKQNILINNQIFIGAGRHMVEYALGSPKRRKQLVATEENPAIEAWIYHFKDEYRPTVLLFDERSLTQAYKASLPEIETLGVEITVAP